jgi:hypothetical protein
MPRRIGTGSQPTTDHRSGTQLPPRFRELARKAGERARARNVAPVLARGSPSPRRPWRAEHAPGARRKVRNCCPKRTHSTPSSPELTRVLTGVDRSFDPLRASIGPGATTFAPAATRSLRPLLWGRLRERPRPRPRPGLGRNKLVRALAEVTTRPCGKRSRRRRTFVTFTLLHSSTESGRGWWSVGRRIWRAMAVAGQSGRGRRSCQRAASGMGMFSG